ncbi:MAG: hypothetical protein LBP59_00090 [Planctomycetaceae bacterium]|nr:hypothetical protein [Planctomycetaceae bacterium]
MLYFFNGWKKITTEQFLLQKIVRRIAGVPPASPDRGRLACTRLYSTANERV